MLNFQSFKIRPKVYDTKSKSVQWMASDKAYKQKFLIYFNQSMALKYNSLRLEARRSQKKPDKTQI
jgi:hypothetical protein